MGASAVAAGVAAGVATYKSECLKIEIDDATALSFFLQSCTVGRQREPCRRRI